MNEGERKVNDLQEFSKYLVLSLGDFCCSKQSSSNACSLSSNVSSTHGGNRMTFISKCTNDLEKLNTDLEVRFEQMVNDLMTSHRVEASIIEENSKDRVSPIERASTSLQACLLSMLATLVTISCTTNKCHSTTVTTHWLNNVYISPFNSEICDQQTEELVTQLHKVLLLIQVKDGDRGDTHIEESLDLLVSQATVIFIADTVALSPSTGEAVVGDKIDQLLQILIPLFIQLLRTTKNLLRLCNVYKDNNATSIPKSTLLVANKFQTLSMMQMYFVIFDMPYLVAQSSTRLLEQEVQDAIVSREACGALLHALRGSDTATVHTFVANIQGVSCLVRKLIGTQPVENIIGIVRMLHVLAGAVPGALTISITNQTSKGSSNKSDIDVQNFSLRTILVATLAWCVRSDSPPFPGSSTDRRPDLAEAILHTLFAMSPGATIQASTGTANLQEEENTMTQLGILLCDILRLPNADVRVYKCKLAVVNLLMDSPPGYAYYLLLNGGIQPLLTILMLQTATLVVERGRSVSTGDALIIVPILAVLHKMCQDLPAAKDMIKVKVFPTHPEENETAAFPIRLESVTNDSTDSRISMEALDAPKATLRWKLIKLMTWTDTRVKRCASELLWTLCNENAKEFVQRTGFGNSVHMLSIKGLVKLPNQSSNM